MYDDYNVMFVVLVESKMLAIKLYENKQLLYFESAARRRIIGGGGGGAPIQKFRRRRRGDFIGGGGAARPAQASALNIEHYITLHM